ncbi:hypothetical protein EX30DRAFT_200348 [Ascodesmis nigricans]|uniref:C2H2-type domain-containing protein n=1 Tax=Ascodesmis nigricans TaxID=341454 RepID=A0A4S2MKD2_9PEZI|nr:hypothetical protein EX30DRAFT_200348 [Ascodesmis nigricans]
MVAPYSPASQQQYQQNGNAQHQPLRNGHPMDNRNPGEYQSGAALSSSSYPYSASHLEPHSSEQSASSQHPQSASQGARSPYSNSGTPTSETGPIYAASRTPAYPADQIVGRPYVDNPHRYPTASSSSGGMTHNLTAIAPSTKTEPKVSEDPSVAAPSPSGYASPGPYAAPSYTPEHHPMNPGYGHHPAAPTQYMSRDGGWSPYGPPPHAMSPYGPHTPSPTTMAAAPPGMVSTARPMSASKANRKRAGDQPNGHPLSQVYSFVPIPGAQQNKRPRRRYEEIERMYKCGWNGCEKAYGTLNHLNAHVTMQGHGVKRTPEEFKEIRKEWKARKKEEEAQRKAQEEENRRRQQEEAAAAAATSTGAESQSSVAAVAAASAYAGAVPQQRTLPPLGYQPNVSLPNGVQYTTTSAPTASMDSIPQYGQPQMYSGYPTSQYPGQPQPIYSSQQQRAAPAQSNGNVSSSTGSSYNS